MNLVLQPEENSFIERLHKHQVPALRVETQTLQVNLGRLCNQICEHCHQGAGPGRSEVMEEATVLRVIELIKATPSIRTLDLTGGAPELNAHFRFLVEQVRALGLEVIDRCNLTVLFEPGQEDTAEWLAANQVQVVASLPCYTQKNVDQQRGDGVFQKSIQGLQKLNALGYGKGTLTLDLVYNPLGPNLPPDQASLEQEYRKRLLEDFGVQFSNLYTITNMPIRRFKRYLVQTGQDEEYQALLERSFNPLAAASIMCKSAVSVDYRGQLFDCDFNLAMDHAPLGSVDDVSELKWTGRTIGYGQHCFGCAAGAGSSCGGALAQETK